MNEQVNVRMPQALLKRAKTYAKRQGFGTVQELIKETLREKLYPETISKEELSLVKKLIRATDEKKLWKSEQEVFAALSR